MAPPTSLTVVMNIKPKMMFTMYEKLRVVRNPFNDKNPYIHFPQNTHFARLVIVPGENEDDVIYPGEQQDRGGVEDRLHRVILWAIFDGPVEDYINQLAELSPNLDDLFQYLEGYEGKDQLLAFLQKYRHKEQVFYSTFPNDSVHTILEKRALRNRLEDLADTNVTRQELIKEGVNTSKVPVYDWRTGARNQFFALLIIGVLLLLGALLWLLANVWWLAVLIIGFIVVVTYTLLIGPLQKANQPFKGQMGAVTDQINEYFDMQKVDQNINRVDPMRLRSREHNLAQNQFNLYLTFKDSGFNRWKRVMQMRLLMIYLNLAGRYLLPQGSLGGLSTAHFGAWVLMDNGRRLFFMTCYDGTWENYIADFVNRIYPMLDVELWNFVGFSDAGTRDISSFRRWLRRVQIQSEVFYSGYPDLTVRNILQDDMLNNNLPKTETDDAELFLALL